ncbi:MAG: CAP domain-containing protein [Cyanobacteria bacterium P01_D01_bin.105]
MKIFNIKQTNRAIKKSHTRKWSVGLATAFALLTATGQMPILDSTFAGALSIDASPAPAIAQSNWASLEQDLITEHNRIRQNPQSYIPLLEARLASMDSRGNIPNGCGRNCTLLTNEGQSAVREAIQYLRNQPPVGAVSSSSGIAQAAKAHATDQRNGSTGHRGSDGSSVMDRINRVGVGHTGVGENIAYGPSTAQDIMINLIVDDGVPSRGHRTNIFRDRWNMAGAGCGPHATYRTVCVINYTSSAR